MKIEKYISESPLFSVLNASHRIDKSLRTHIGDANLNPFQALILVSLYFEKGEVFPSQLSRSLRVSPSTVSQSLNFLHRKKWIQRQMVEDDARKYRIVLTPQGNLKIQKLIKAFNGIQKHIEDHLGLADTRQMVSGIDRLCSILQ